MSKSDVWVQFYNKPVEDKKASREAGRPIYRDAEFVHIKYPGDMKRELHKPAHEYGYLPQPEDRERGLPTHPSGKISAAERWPEHYRLFKSQAEQVVGTPLAELPFLTESQRMTLRGANVLTAEALAGMPDRDVKKLGMGARAMKDQAKAYLESAKDNAATSKLAAENAEMAERLKAMEAMLADLQKTEAA